jgi:DNA-binding CsgD family transcriptional regulator
MDAVLTPAQERDLAAWSAELDVIRPGEDGMSGTLLDALEDVGVQFPHTYSWHELRNLVVVETAHGKHFDYRQLAKNYQTELQFTRLIQYDPRSVEVRHQNRALLSRELATPEKLALLRSTLRPYVPGMHDQLRVLICDGSSMLGWVGGFARQPFTSLHREKLQRLVPSIQRRLIYRARLAEAGLVHAALEAALEALPAPAMILDEKRRVVHRAASARELSPTDEVELTPIEANGLGRHYLAMVKPRGRVDFARLEGRYGLTARERQVLEVVVAGRTNRAIAVHLACSERTVEAHLERLLTKLQVASRGELVARVWKEASW